MLGLGLAAAAVTLPPRAWAASDPVVITGHGPVRGLRQDGIDVFKGIRYGADTGQRRFQAPQPPVPWREVRDALSYGAACPQTHFDERQSEDCLFLNVWTAEAKAGGNRPVMVYIHGGAYSHGSGSDPLYDGTRLVHRGDVVVVTLNHRLNALGHLYLGRLAGAAYAQSGNAGILDLVLALRWVRDNIAAFGGDPGRVMLFGQSGGGAKIATLMATPAAQGLFHRAATMSGQQVTASGPLNATARATAYLAALGLTPERAAEAATLPVERLLSALNAADPIHGVAGQGMGGLYWGPVLDDQVLAHHPFYPDAPAQSAAIPMIIGNTHDETRLLIGGSDPSTFTLTWDQVPGLLAKHMRVDINPDLVVAEYRRLYPAYSPSDVFFAATTAGRSWRAAVMEAEARAIQALGQEAGGQEAGGQGPGRQGAAPTYAYQLNWGSPKDGGKWRAPHTLDIPLVFDNTAVPDALSTDSAEARHLADQMSNAFIAFARTGDPNVGGAPRWTPYTLAGRETLVFDLESRLEADPRGAERRLFARVPFTQQGT
ncbi:carboxylesterase/lipase family protein [Nitrospirillum sp. BR 11828]|uniref:carboxylesterase/lipase family protein n=1 Tax=Nitrospirillum sp. BR 11828 TaxID=3104325 RepID=UPI002ACA3A6B|nr:carboxylesterase/lipase family protein [Nitrospirillum sp. BR 11828]MDZ5647912.1 carboxylesterase/lipase family protein [Nitrospirillum sp. BR 11828]